MQRAVCTVFALVLLLSLPLLAQTIVLEAPSGVLELTPCDTVHIQGTCNYKHVEVELAPSIGGLIQLDGESYVVEWIGPGYYLDSGIVLQPRGITKRGLKGQRWVEVYPRQGKVHTSRAWRDVDGNRTLSPSDMLTLDGGSALMVKDVRLQLRVRPALPEP